MQEYSQDYEFYFHILAELNKHNMMSPVAEDLRNKLLFAVWNTDTTEEQLLEIVRNVVAENNGLVRLF